MTLEGGVRVRCQCLLSRGSAQAEPGSVRQRKSNAGGRRVCNHVPAGWPYAGWPPSVSTCESNCFNHPMCATRVTQCPANHHPMCVQTPRAVQPAATNALASTKPRPTMGSVKCTLQYHHSTHPTWAVTRTQQDSGSSTKGCRKQGYKYRFARIQSPARQSWRMWLPFCTSCAWHTYSQPIASTSYNHPPASQPTAHTCCTRLRGSQPAAYSMPSMPLCQQAVVCTDYTWQPG